MFKTRELQEKILTLYSSDPPKAKREVLGANSTLDQVLRHFLRRHSVPIVKTPFFARNMTHNKAFALPINPQLTSDAEKEIYMQLEYNRIEITMLYGILSLILLIILAFAIYTLYKKQVQFQPLQQRDVELEPVAQGQLID